MILEKLESKIKRRKSLLQTIRFGFGVEVDQIIKGKKQVKEIEIKDSFFTFIEKIKKIKEFKELDEKGKQEICDKLFTILNRAGDLDSNKKPSTANISSIFVSLSGIKTLFSVSKKEIKELFYFLDEKGIQFTSITGMQKGRGLPDLKELEKFIEFIKTKKLDLSSITGMQAGRGVPDLKELEKFIKFIKTEEIDLSSITGMQAGRGVPDLKKLENFIKVCKEKNIDIRNITSKQLGLEESLRLVKTL